MRIESSASPSNERGRTLSPAIKPLLTIIVIIAAISGVAYGLMSSGQDPYTTLLIFSTRFLGIFIEAVPFLLLGTITSGLIEAFVRTEDIVRHLPGNRFVSTFAGVFMGMIFPVCECGVVPVTRRLFTKGLPMSVGVAFLLAAPVMNPIVFASTFIAFGWGPVLIGRFAITLLVALLIGLIFALTARPEEVLKPASMMCDPTDGIQPPRRSLREGLSVALSVASNEFFEMGRFLIIGCLMAAAMQTVVPQTVLLSLGSGTLVSVLLMQTLAFILSVCSTVDSFLALAFTNTFTLGSILAFLSFGPMVDVKSTMMFMGVFQRRVVFYLILLPFAMNLFIGVLINVWLS